MKSSTIHPQPEQRCSAVSLDSARAIASEYITRAETESFDAENVLRERPELWEHKSVVLDLAYEQFLRTAESGQNLQVSQFAARFPKWQASLQRMLQVHDFLDASAELGTLNWPDVGDEFAGFQLRKELGRGAFSRVFLATEPGVGGRSVVVKAVAKVHSDADMLGKLEHPHIVPVYSVSRDESFGLTAICMPYLGRTTLFDVLQSSFGEDDTCPQQGIVFHEAIEQANLNVDDLHRLRRDYPFSGMSYVDAVLEIAIQITEALKYVHRCGIYHCDIKPSNVLLTSSGEAKLFDFNLALADDSSSDQVGGTLAYMAPELLAAFTDGNSVGVQVDARTDIFSLGVMLYEMLTGKLPFDLPRDIEDRRELARHLLVQQAAGPGSLVKANEAVNRSLADVIERCLVADPVARHENATILLDCLRRERTRRRKSSRRKFVKAISGCGIALGLGATAFLLIKREEEPSRLKTGPLDSSTSTEKARKAREAGRYAEALDHYDQAIREHPGNVRLVFERGHTYLDRREFDKALDQYARVRRERGRSSLVTTEEVAAALARAHFYKGRCLTIGAAEPDYVRAKAEFDKATRELRSLADVKQELMIVQAHDALCLAHRWSDSRGPDYVGAASRLLPCVDVPALQEAALHNNLGYCGRMLLSEGKEYKGDAESNFKIAIKKNPSLHTPYRNLTYLYLLLCKEKQDGPKLEDLLSKAMQALGDAVQWIPEEKHFYFDVLILAARGAHLAVEENSKSAMDWLSLAVELAKTAKSNGLDLAKIRRAVMECPELGLEPAFQALFENQPLANSAAMDLAEHTLDPLTDLKEEVLGVLRYPR
jgi:serine/threonine protein kinase